MQVPQRHNSVLGKTFPCYILIPHNLYQDYEKAKYPYGNYHNIPVNENFPQDGFRVLNQALQERRLHLWSAVKKKYILPQRLVYVNNTEIGLDMPSGRLVGVSIHQVGSLFLLEKEEEI